jgi:hypothetical protein
MAYRFKTKEEFIRDDLWDYGHNVPKRWNYAGNMNHYLGMTIPSEYESYCENKKDFSMDGWSFLSSDYVKIEEKKEESFNTSDVIDQWVEAIVDNPFSTSLKKGDFLYVSSSKRGTCLKGISWSISDPLSSRFKKTSPGFIPNRALKTYEKIVREKYPIGTQVTNHNLGLDCDFEIKQHAFSDSSDYEILVRGKYGGLYTIFKNGVWAEIKSPVQTYFPDLSLHVGRYIKALVDKPFGGAVKAGDIGKIIDEHDADFPSHKNYSCKSALHKAFLGIKFELMPEGYVPSAEEFKNSEKENEVDMLQIQYENGAYAQRISGTEFGYISSAIDPFEQEKLVDKIEKKESRKTSIVNVQTVDVELKSTKRNKIKFKF